MIRYKVLGVSAMRKKVLSALMIAMLGVLPSFGRSLVVNLTDGTEIVCSLAKEPQMLFGEKTITLTSLAGEVGQWSFSSVESWKFSDQPDQDEIDAVDKVKSEKPRIMIEEGRITVAGKNVKDAAVYDTNGRLMINVQCSTPKGSQAESASEVATFNVNKLAKGTYLLKVGDSCVKFSVGR